MTDNIRTVPLIAFILMAGLTLSSPTQAEEAQCKYILLHGEPRGMRDYNVLLKDMYAIAVDDKTKTIDWVSYCLDSELVKTYESKPGGRSAPWLDEVPVESEPVPSASFGGVESPETADNLKQMMLRLDEQARALALSGYVVHVMAGPLFDESNAIEGFWGIIAVPLSRTDIRTVGFIFDRAAQPGGRLAEHQCTVAEIEERTGLDFMPRLPEDVEEQIKTTISIQINS